MSLFQGLFASGNAASDLFSDGSRFKAVPAPVVAASSAAPGLNHEAPASDSATAAKSNKKRDRDDTTGSEHAPKAGKKQKQGKMSVPDGGSLPPPAAAKRRTATHDGAEPDGSAPKRRKEGLAATAAAAPEHPGEQPDVATAAAREPKPRLSQEEEEAKLRRTLFVGNVPPSLTRKELKKLFAAHGAVESVRLRSVPLAVDAKLPRRAAVMAGKASSDRGSLHAYVVFEDVASVDGALALNMAEVDGHHIRVDRAAAPTGKGDGAGAGAAAVYNPMRSVFVGNLDFRVSDEDVVRAFNGSADPAAPAELSGAVEAVRVVRDAATNIGKGFAFVLFKTKAAARAALQLDGHKLGGRAMRVTRAAAAAAPGKRGASGGGRGRGAGGDAGVAAGRVPARSRPAAAPAGDWQGTRTKGKGHDRARGVKVGRAANGAQSPAGSAAASKSKRPAVAARKAKMLAEAGRAAKSAEPRMDAGQARPAAPQQAPRPERAEEAGRDRYQGGPAAGGRGSGVGFARRGGGRGGFAGRSGGRGAASARGRGGRGLAASARGRGGRGFAGRGGRRGTGRGGG